MDSGLGTMAPISEKKAKELEAHGLKFFKQGEILYIKESKFKVSDITNTTLYLKILPN